jgi:hypothetical protein
MPRNPGDYFKQHFKVRDFNKHGIMLWFSRNHLIRRDVGNQLKYLMKQFLGHFLEHRGVRHPSYWYSSQISRCGVDNQYQRSSNVSFGNHSLGHLK